MVPEVAHVRGFITYVSMSDARDPKLFTNDKCFFVISGTHIMNIWRISLFLKYIFNHILSTKHLRTVLIFVLETLAFLMYLFNRSEIYKFVSDKLDRMSHNIRLENDFGE